GTGVTFSGNTPSVTATFAANANSAQVRVSATNACGTSTVRSRNITVNPLPGAAGTISGPTSVCANSTGNVYSISSVTGATGYSWSVPSGATITAGNNSTSITVSFASGAGNVTVTPINSCGSGQSRSITVSINTSNCGAPDVSTISGPDNVNMNQQGVTYSVPNFEGATFVWSVPPGAIIVSGQGTNSIVVDFGVTGGEVSVDVTNEFGTSTVSKNVVINGPTNVNSSSVYSLSLYPNPAESNAVLEITTSIAQTMLIKVYQINSNEVVEELSVQSNEKIVFGENLGAGMYMVEVISGNNRRVIKWVKL
ncbi:MAG: T9SS type A sorting domain-containing protein, partial [Cytophagaceae bacterium]